MTAQQRTILIAVAAAALAFMLGAAWQYASVRDARDELEQVTADLALQRLEATLGAATIEAQRGSFEIGRQLASEFFSRLQTAVPEIPSDGRDAFARILDSRDVVITALSRSDPQSGPMLAQLFVRYRMAMGEPVGPQVGAEGSDQP